MKHQARTVDIRIKKFMEKKLSKYPELRDQAPTHVEVAMRGDRWEDITNFFKMKKLSY